MLIKKLKKLLNKKHKCGICGKKCNCIDLDYNMWICSDSECNKEANKTVKNKPKVKIKNKPIVNDKKWKI